MRAARLLSLSNNGALDKTSDPYQQAITCVVAIDALSERLRGTALDEEQKQGLVSARSLYRRKALGTGKTATEVGRDVESRKSSTDDPNQRLLAAISCLRELA